MRTYHLADFRRNHTQPSNLGAHEPLLTKGGKVVRRTRPHLSASLCNAIAALAGLDKEVRNG